MKKQLVFRMDEKYQEYLIDESKLKGYADSISFPESEEEVIEVVNEMRRQAVSVTIQSAKTGIVGGAVPFGGHIMNLSGMKQVVETKEFKNGQACIAVEPGLNLMELKNEIDKRFRRPSVFWPPRPTEDSSTVGGILASAAKGINSCHYGDSRRYIDKIRLVKADGTVEEIKRGAKKRMIDDEEIDELDLILGGEGIYGAITRAWLTLLPKPQEVWGISFFFESKEQAYAFADGLSLIDSVEGAYLDGAEYLDRSTIDLIEGRKETMTKIRELPNVGASVQAMIYIEIAGDGEVVEEMAGILMELAEENGSDPDTAWAVSGESEVARMHAFRHGAAETANLHLEKVRRTDERIIKLGADMSLKNYSFAELAGMYETELKKSGLNGCIFGHIMDRHLHVNILPEHYEDYQAGKNLMEQWIKTIARNGGKVSSEHGLGKLKNQYVNLAFSEEMRKNMLELKAMYDPENFWNRGNIF